ncbi:MAG: 1-acyl-sn-glycerol-3-phosphate acyltransferase [Burkholderiaceae bacterium]
MHNRLVLTEPVTLPLWAFIALSALALWSLMVLLLAPGMRWFLRRRVNRMIDHLNRTLSIGLPTFKLTRRQAIIERLFHDPAVQAAIARHASESGEPMNELWRRVDGYVREIVPSFNAYLYYRIGYKLARTVARTLYRVRIGFAAEDALRSIAPDSTLVFVINHRSNMDYVLVAFLAAERVTLSYAVGEWARIWGLQQLVRAMGAFFVRRNSGDPLYRVVLSRYVGMATEGGVTQAIFPEGGLTADGACARRDSACSTTCSGLRSKTGRRPSRHRVPAGRAELRPGARRPHPVAEAARRRPEDRSYGRRGQDGGFRRQATRLRDQGSLAPIRLRVRELRRADLDARLVRDARHGFHRARRRRAPAGGDPGRRAPDDPHRRRRSGLAGLVAGIDPDAGARPPLDRTRAQGRDARSDGDASAPAHTPTRRARTRTTRSASDCGCWCCARS